MIAFDLVEADDVVDEVGQCHVGLGSQNAHATKKQTAHRMLDETEHVFRWWGQTTKLASIIFPSQTIRPSVLRWV